MEQSKTNTEPGTKRRACDECRARKLACSKSPNGCERCLRESISCHYSEQKPMGRPRKRQFVEVTRDESMAFNARNESEQQGEFQHDFEMPSFDDDFLDYNNTNISEPYMTTLDPLLPIQDFPLDNTLNVHCDSTTYDGRETFHFGSHGLVVDAPIDFSALGEGHQKEGRIPPNEQSTTPELSSSSSDGLNISVEPCSCLPAMYLSLSALQQFPKDITQALKVVRAAASTAGKSIWCPYCGASALMVAVPRMEAFQNMMLLGTILPIIANGYARLLGMVDETTSNAILKGQNIKFKYLEYGGLCEERSCFLDFIEGFENTAPDTDTEMQPEQWRTLVRAILRVDLYGHEQPGFKHKGLKGIIEEVERRQNTRHDVLDAQIAAGIRTTADGHNLDVRPTCNGENPRGCLEIFKIAKLAVDRIIIA